MTQLLFNPKDIETISTKKKIKHVKKNKSCESKKEAQHRYYLHHRIKKKYKIQSRKRLIEVPYNDFESGIPDLFKKYFTELTQKNYSVQSTIN
ncbi:MAG: hypothetical protein JEY96_01650 [Bacteroidales bacterium]|jgi:hypothetical protein|nr:hypothetical protein [Bacteroidales bacterium]